MTQAADTTRWLDDEEMAAWRGLIETFGDLTSVLDTELLEQHGIPLHGYATLVGLSEAPDRRLRMCDLAARLHV